MIVKIEPKPLVKGSRQKLFMYPLQITLAPDEHADSHKMFFDDYKSWTYKLDEFDVVPTFFWISPKVTSRKLCTPTDEDIWPAHYVEYIPISQVHAQLWSAYNHATKYRQTQRAPKPPASRNRQGVAEQEVSKDLEGQGEQVKLGEPSNGARPSGEEAKGSGGSGSRGNESLRSWDRRKVYQRMTLNELKLELKSRKLRWTGKKDELVNRLVEHDQGS
jgi:hypothetical protein